ncbi:MFS transporter [Roseomonas elaeocarpi]|uniref:MFS transporter n=1 Tax=Roseomonas elaeocarpi TaxID=907779 RepID=A0ABV6JVG2_9PROT
MQSSIGGHQERSGVRWRIFAIIGLLTVINLADRTTLSVGMPTLARELDLSPTMQGLILSSFFWTYALLQVPGGYLIDRLGPSRVITASTLLWGVFQTAAAFATGGLSLLLTRLGLGAAEAPLFPAGGKLNALWLSGRERGRGAVLMDSGSYLGAGLGGGAIAWLIFTFDSWRIAFAVAGLVTIGAGLLAWWYLHDDPARHPSVSAAELEHIRAPVPGIASAVPPGTPIDPRAVAPVMAGRFGWAMMNFGLITWGPSYLAQARGFDLKQMGGAMVVIFLCGFLGSLAAGFGADALQRRGLSRTVVLKSMLGLSGLGVLSAFLLLPTIADPVAAVALLSCTTFLLCFGSLYWSFPALLAPADRIGVVGGLMNMAGSVGGIAVPIVVGAIIQATGSYTTALHFFAGCAALYVAGTLLVPLARGDVQARAARAVRA